MQPNSKTITALLCATSAIGITAYQAFAQAPQAPAAPLHLQVPGRDLNQQPIAFSGATLTFQSENAASIAVTTPEKEKLTPIRMEVGNALSTLTPAADGTLRGQVVASLSEMRAENERRIRMKDQEIPIFEGRTQVAVRKASSFVIANEQLTTGKAIPIISVGNPANIDIARSLLINDPSVTQDPTRTRTSCATPSLGAWSFGHLMNQMANQQQTGISGSELARRWLQRFQFPQVVNDQISNPHPAVVSQILAKWQALSGANNPLDMGKAPFRLLAIVNRVDLRKSTSYGGGDAGEARFVFGAVDPQTCAPLQFTAIFEYEVPRKLCNDIKAWAKRWKDLDQHPLGSPAYRAALQLITDDFTKANANPAKQNGSALGQLRTNEKLGPPDWQLREFRLSPANGGHLEQVTVKQTPANSFDKTPTLASFVASKLNAILAEKHAVPLQFPTGTPFLAAHADTPNLNWTWDQGTGKVITNRPARHKFALNTCNGCHGGEANTILFKHIDVAGYTPTAAGLSKFLTGEVNRPDPADGSPARSFNDLKRRAADLDALINSPCFMHPFMAPGTMVH